ncbi:hypothetical protein [Rhodopirellula sp. MGV]|uniref:hypothetical protein n=1 Tax=Rhodopirellula sp. MGV TaxID=2023130 RepID=UPI001E4314ED|nr:hypothetical protein [Rhodopirellula sp. MGV]
MSQPNRFPGVTLWCAILFVWGILVGGSTAWAQQTDLASRQNGVADRYQRLEELLLRLADVEAAENPERAALLRRAAKESREKFVLQQLRTASDSLRNEKYSDAINNQDTATKGLGEILKLLTSEDRANRIRDEKERVAQMIKDLKRIERSQRSTRARTENGADMQQLGKEQKSLRDRGEDLQREMSEENEFDNADSSDSESSDSESSDNSAEENSNDEQSDASGEESGEKSPSESEPKPGEESDQDSSGEPKSSESDSKDLEQQSQQGEEGQQGEQSKQSQQGKPGQQGEQSQQGEKGEQGQEGEQGQQSQQSQQSPQQAAEQKLQDAIQKMRQAEKELEEAKRDEAVEQQIAAEENLRQAIDQLEQILRQLREEEMQRELARLESRLKKMAAMQSKVLEDTAQLAETPKSQRNRQTDLRAGDLSFEQKKITVEADRAMLLLREEGSSVAFPEVVEQIRNDSDRIAQRLGNSQIDAVTQGIQQDVLAAIEEMITALQQAQRDLEKQKQQEGQSGQQQAGQPGEQPLVGAISELKLIRTMEKRIQTTTQRYSGLLQSDETSAQDLLPMLKNLSERQDRLYKITRDLLMRRNQ